MKTETDNVNTPEHYIAEGKKVYAHQPRCRGKPKVLKELRLQEIKDENRNRQRKHP